MWSAKNVSKAVPYDKELSKWNLNLQSKSNIHENKTATNI